MQNSYVLGQKVTKRKYWLFNLLLFVVVSLFMFGSLYSSVPLQLVLADQSSNLSAIDYRKVQPLDSLHNPFSSLISEQLAGTLPDGSGFFVASKDTNFENSADKVFKSASLYKLFVAHAVLEQVDAGTRSLDDPMLKELTLGQCLEIMINVSDNPCGVEMQSWANTSAFNQTLLDRGYQCSDMSGYFPTTCAQDVIKLLQDIDNSTYLSEASSELMLAHMANQKITDRIPAGLPDYQVLNKTADLSDVAHDAAIVRLENGESAYLVVMTDSDQNRATTYSQIAEFAQSAISNL